MAMKPDQFRERCRGIVPVQFCPYTRDLSRIDLEALKSNTRFLVDFAGKGDKDMLILTNGSTTEFYANSIAEQRSIIEAVVDEVGGAVPVIAGVSGAGTDETVKMARYARDAGVDCVMVALPYYHTPFREGTFQHFQVVAEAVDIAVMIYNNPDVTGAVIDPEMAARLSQIGNVVAIKDNTPIATEFFFKALLVKPGDMSLLNGMGEIAYVASASYGFGYRGFVSFIANFAPQLSYDLYQAIAKERDFAKGYEVLRKLAPFWRLLIKLSAQRGSPSLIPGGYKASYAYMDLGKAAMDMVGLYGGPVRLPFEDTGDEELKQLKAVLNGMGLI